MLFIPERSKTHYAQADLAELLVCCLQVNIKPIQFEGPNRPKTTQIHHQLDQSKQTNPRLHIEKHCFTHISPTT